MILGNPQFSLHLLERNAFGFRVNAENRITTDASVTYSYDADGVRIEKSSGTKYWPGPSGALTESNLTGTINEEYIYFNGTRIARVDRPSGVVHFYFSNQVGSHTVVTSATGGCEQDIDYFPYGGVVADYCGTVAQHYKFGGKERDSESGLDNFGARYYGSSMGRFMSPDWAARPTAVPYAVYGDPQSLNLYTYVRNNTLNRSDPDGHYSEFPAGCQTDDDKCVNRYAQEARHTAQNKKPPTETPSQKMAKRIVAGISGVVNIALGVGKIKVAAGLGVASTVDGPAAVATGTGAAYLGINGTGHVVTGAANLTYAATGDERAETAAKVTTAMTTVGGLVTLAKTRDVNSAAVVGQLESPMAGAAVSSEWGESAVELLSTALEWAASPPLPPPPPSPQPPPQQ
jgi:RHS repeat-associated protein